MGWCGRRTFFCLRAEHLQRARLHAVEARYGQRGCEAAEEVGLDEDGVLRGGLGVKGCALGVVERVMDAAFLGGQVGGHGRGVRALLAHLRGCHVARERVRRALNWIECLYGLAIGSEVEVM